MTLEKITKSAGWSMLEAFGQVVLSMIGLVVLARILGPKDFGIAMLALAIVQILNLLIEYLFREAIVQRRDLQPGHLDTAFWTIVGLSIVIVAGCWAGADLIAIPFGDPRLAGLLRGMSVTLIFSAVTGITIGWLRRRMMFRQIAIGTVCGRLAGSGTAIAMALSGAGVWSLVGQQIATYVVVALISWHFTQWRPRLHFSIPRLKELSRFALPMLASEAILVGNQRLFYVAVGLLFGPTILGYFSLAARLTETVRDVVGTVTHQLTMSIFAQQQADAAQLRQSVYATMRFTSIIVVPVFTGIALCAPEILTVLFGPTWQPSVPLMRLLAMGSLVGLAFGAVNTALTATGRPVWRLVKNAVDMAVSIGGLFLLAGFGYVVAGSVLLLRQVFSLPPVLIAGGRIIGVGMGGIARSVGPAAIAAIAMTAAVLAVRAFLPGDFGPDEFGMIARLALMIVTGMAVYPIVLLLVSPDLIGHGRAILASVRRPPPRSVKSTAEPAAEPDAPI